MSVNTGSIKWFSDERGYGFIVPDNGGNDVFVHVTALKSSGVHPVEEGQKVSYDLDEERAKPCAINLERIAS